MHILLVEDDPGIRAVATMALERVGGFQVTTAQSGADALAVVGTVKPDLILLDMMMPALDGLQTLRALREQGLDTPVLFLTARTAPAELEAYVDAGAIGTIAKPFDPMTLSDQVRAAVRGSRAE